MYIYGTHTRAPEHAPARTHTDGQLSLWTSCYIVTSILMPVLCGYHIVAMAGEVSS